MIVKITAAGTITIPKQFRRYMDVRRGDYVKVELEGDRLVVTKAVVS
ncbi:MAG: AbrB/MazE/SpoVT family DNA-binding domain-containing protein [Thaumarchaeota archaeon]|nr:AbrB/MazE/SpoVT family DNA-binding domain-containing protein [Nitrososphaerota archaeon]MDD9813877.1 AbrB/MazE/SpoVT family DNA-binding domain-containing protein [Nitrososphaerota archaeon]MDD9825970.1 AbrB/MazE/SpoVT family DNA-binding domain-containing protein [Nitrososphaerota archaeon]MDD9842802.1 AbrB/MazE/SpoVT family DNA-binding domain-containing protein [Nitrososphaerota archaeon]